MAKKEELIVGLDLGTTKVCAVVGEVTTEGIDIVGVGTYPSAGLRGGVVVNIDQTVNSIKKAVEEAELMAGCDISSVFAGVAGTHVQSLNSHGVIAIKSREVTQSDVARVLDAAKTIALPFDRQILHVLPQQYIVDDQDGIHYPIGMAGVRLEAKVHIITAMTSAVQNIVKCCERAGLQVQDVVLESLASSGAVLDSDEKHLGVALIDIGGGTSEIAVFQNNAIRHSTVVGLGGNHITSDISVGLRCAMDEAEKIKKKYGCALAELVNQQDVIEVGSVGGQKPRQLAQSILTQIIEARVKEILDIIEWELVRSGFIEILARRGGPHRRCFAAAGNSRACRKSVRHAGENRGPMQFRRSGRRREKPDLLDGSRTSALRKRSRRRDADAGFARQSRIDLGNS